MENNNLDRLISVNQTLAFSQVSQKDGLTSRMTEGAQLLASKARRFTLVTLLPLLMASTIGLAATPAHAADVTNPDQPSLLGAVVGGASGIALGNQIGGGTGKVISKVVLGGLGAIFGSSLFGHDNAVPYGMVYNNLGQPINFAKSSVARQFSGHDKPSALLSPEADSGISEDMNLMLKYRQASENDASLQHQLEHDLTFAPLSRRADLESKIRGLSRQTEIDLGCFSSARGLTLAQLDAAAQQHMDISKFKATFEANADYKQAHDYLYQGTHQAQDARNHPPKKKHGIF